MAPKRTKLTACLIVASACWAPASWAQGPATSSALLPLSLDCLPMPYDLPPAMTQPGGEQPGRPVDPGASAEGDATGQQPSQSQIPQQNLNIPQANNQNQQLAASSGGRSVAPGMIGDFFGSTDSQFARIYLDRLFVFAPTFFPDAAQSTLIPGQPVTVVDPNAIQQFGAARQGAGAIVTLPGAGFAFTSVENLEAVQAQIQNVSNPFALIRIIDNDAYRLAASQQAAALYGPGEIEFIADPLAASNAADFIDYVSNNAIPNYVVPQNQGSAAVTTTLPDAGDVFLGAIAGGVVYAYEYYVNVLIPGGDLASSPSARVGRQKLTEGASPLPRDRLFVNYSYFDNTPLAPGGANVNRVTPGFEKTFFNNQASFEFRLPFATTLDSTLQEGATNTGSAELGDLTLYFKSLLFVTDSWAVSGGLGITLPTADDFRIRDRDGVDVLAVENKAVHLLPFLGALYTPNDRLFAQGFLQFDFDGNGNPFYVSSLDPTSMAPTGNLTQVDRLNDRSYLFLDLNVGYWVYLNPNSGSCVTGLAPVLEFHYNQAMTPGSSASGGPGMVPIVFARPGRFNANNVVFGMTAMLKDHATLTAGYTLPVGGEDQFDGEFRLVFNWLFGASRPDLNRMARVQGL